MREPEIVVVSAEPDTPRVNFQHPLQAPLGGFKGKPDHGRYADSDDALGGGRRELSRHLTAKTAKPEWTDGKGLAMRWLRNHHTSHWRDSWIVAIRALDSLQCRVIDEPKTRWSEWRKRRVRAESIAGRRIVPR
jgi:hypothetical protein